MGWGPDDYDAAPAEMIQEIMQMIIEGSKE
jgi:hypothetical protein